MVNPTADALAIEAELSRKPTLTTMSVPVSESRRFWAWAGPCEDHPITPIWLTPSKAFVRSGNRSRPPGTMVSVVSPRLMVRVSKTFDVKLDFIVLYVYGLRKRVILHWRARER